MGANASPKRNDVKFLVNKLHSSGRCFSGTCISTLVVKHPGGDVFFGAGGRLGWGAYVGHFGVHLGPLWRFLYENTGN